MFLAHHPILGPDYLCDHVHLYREAVPILAKSLRDVTFSRNLTTSQRSSQLAQTPPRPARPPRSPRPSRPPITPTKHQPRPPARTPRTPQPPQYHQHHQHTHTTKSTQPPTTQPEHPLPWTQCLPELSVNPLTPLSDHSKITVCLRRAHSNYEAYQKAFEMPKSNTQSIYFFLKYFPIIMMV